MSDSGPLSHALWRHRALPQGKRPLWERGDKRNAARQPRIARDFFFVAPAGGKALCGAGAQRGANVAAHDLFWTGSIRTCMGAAGLVSENYVMGESALDDGKNIPSNSKARPSLTEWGAYEVEPSGNGKAADSHQMHSASSSTHLLSTTEKSSVIAGAEKRGGWGVIHT